MKTSYILKTSQDILFEFESDDTIQRDIHYKVLLEREDLKIKDIENEKLPFSVFIDDDRHMLIEIVKITRV